MATEIMMTIGRACWPRANLVVLDVTKNCCEQNKRHVHPDRPGDAFMQFRVLLISVKGLVAVRGHHAKCCPEQLAAIDRFDYQVAKRMPSTIGDRDARKDRERQGDRNRYIYCDPAEIAPDLHDDCVVHCWQGERGAKIKGTNCLARMPPNYANQMQIVWRL